MRHRGWGGRVSQHSSLDGADSLTSCCCHGRVTCTVVAPFIANVLTDTESTPRGFEPLRAEPNGFLVHHLSHSVTVSDGILGFVAKQKHNFKAYRAQKFRPTDMLRSMRRALARIRVCPYFERMRTTTAARHTMHPAMHIHEYGRNGAACRHPLHSYGDSVTGGGMS